MDTFGNTLDNLHIGDTEITGSLTVEGETEIPGDIKVGTITSTGDVKIGGDLEVVGDIVARDELVIEDSLWEVNSVAGLSNNTNAIGYFGPYNTGVQLWTGFIRDYATNRYKLVDNETTKPLSSNTTYSNLGSLDLLEITASTSMDVPVITHSTSLDLKIGGDNKLEMTSTDSKLSTNLNVLGEATIGPRTEDLVAFTLTNVSSVGVSSGTNYKQHGFNFTTHEDITLTHFQLQNSLAISGSQWYLTLWNVSGAVKIHNEYVLATDPLINSSYTHELSAPIAIPSGSNYLLVVNFLTTGSNRKFDTSPNLTNTNSAQVTAIGGVIDIGGGDGSATETGNIYPTSVGTGTNFSYACNFLFTSGIEAVKITTSDSKINNTLLISDGTEAAPALAFTSTTGNGFYTGSNKTNVSTLGVKTFQFASDHTYSVPPMYSVRDRYPTWGLPVVCGLCTGLDTRVFIGNGVGDIDITTNIIQGSRTIYGNTAKQGDNLKLIISGLLTMTNNDTATFFLKLGSTKIVTAPAMTFPALSLAYFQIEGEISFRTDASASTNIVSTIEFNYPDSTFTKQSSGQCTVLNGINMTGDVDLTAGLVWGQSNTGNVLYCHQLHIDGCFW